MTADERRTQLVELMTREGYIELGKLVGRLGVSESTIRRDLNLLAQQGLLVRTHGGAVSVSSRDHSLNFSDREQSAVPEKRAIGKAAAEMIGDGQAVMLDSGTTTFHVAKHLIGRSLQVVTNSIPVAQLLGGSPQIELTFIGGYVYPRTGATMGPLAEETLKHVHVSKFFCGAAGITERGLFAVNVMLAEVDRRMIERSDEVIILADHTKFGKSAVAPLCELNTAQRLICDEGLTPQWQKAVRDAGVDLILAELDADDRAERGDG